MRAQAEFFLFALAAVCVHAAGFAVSPDSGEQASGEQGEFLLSLQGSTAQIEQLVEDWTVAPDIAPEMPQIAAPDTASMAPPTPTLDTSANIQAPNAPVQLQMPTAPGAPTVQTDSPLPSIVTKTAEPPKPKVKPKPKAKVVPKPKPKPEPKAKANPAPKKKPKATAKKAKPATQGQRAQKAAGQGGKTSDGTTGKAKVKTGSAASSAKAMDVWGAQIRRTIERRKRSVRGLKRRARATVAVTVAANGQVLNYRLSKSSKNKKADRAALQAVNAAGNMPRAVKGVAVRSHTFHVPMIFNP